MCRKPSWSGYCNTAVKKNMRPDNLDRDVKSPAQQRANKAQRQGQNLYFYLPNHGKLLSLLCIYPVLFWLLNLVLFPKTFYLNPAAAATANSGQALYGLLLLGFSLLLLLLTAYYAFAVRVVLSRRRFYWRSGLDFRLNHCPYTSIRQLRFVEKLQRRQPVYDFILLLHHERPATLSLGFGNSMRLIRAFIRRGIPVSPELMQYFLYSHSRESKLMQRYWGRTHQAEALRHRLKRVLQRHSQQVCRRSTSSTNAQPEAQQKQNISGHHSRLSDSDS